MLPDLSGIEVCRRLKAEPATAGMPVIMLTARGEELDRVMGFEVGVDDYVVKPFSARELLLRILSEDEEEVMPPPKKGKRFTPEQADLIRRWIAQGGKYETLRSSVEQWWQY
jgi:DNA-binding response OmpR family regulator